MSFDNVREIGELRTFSDTQVDGESLQIIELSREDQIFSHNDLAKFEIASELRLQGVSITSISRILNIPQEELFAEFEQV